MIRPVIPEEGKREYPEFANKPVNVKLHGKIHACLVVACDYHVGVTINYVHKKNESKPSQIFCMNGEASPNKENHEWFRATYAGDFLVIVNGITKGFIDADTYKETQAIACGRQVSESCRPTECAYGV